MNKLTAPQRLQLALEMGKKRDAMLETRLKAVTAFYGQLNPAQQTLFDEHGLARPHMMRAGWRQHGRHGGWGEHGGERGGDQRGWGGDHGPRQG